MWSQMFDIPTRENCGLSAKKGNINNINPHLIPPPPRSVLYELLFHLLTQS